MSAIIPRSARLAVALAVLTAPGGAQEPVAQVPFTSPSNLIVLEGAIGESGPMTFMLDTGAGRTVLDAPVVDLLGLRVTGQGRAMGASGSMPMRVLADVPVRLGGVELQLPMAVALAFAELEPALGMDVDAVVGHELFTRYVVQIDYAAGTVRLFDPAAFVAPQAPSVPLEVQGTPRSSPCGSRRTGARWKRGCGWTPGPGARLRSPPRSCARTGWRRGRGSPAARRGGWAGARWR